MLEIQSALQGRFSGGVFAEDKKVGLRRGTQGPTPGPWREGGGARYPIVRRGRDSSVQRAASTLRYTQGLMGCSQ